MGLKVEGLEELGRKLKKNIEMSDVKKIVRHNGAELQIRMMDKADFKMGYQTGTTKRSITLNMQDSGMTAEVQPMTEYSPYLEYGTRFMSAQPFVRPAFNEQKPKFLNDLRKVTE